MHADGDWYVVEGVLTKDMATVGECLQTWKLKFSTTKTVSPGFHLKNKEAKRELNTLTSGRKRGFSIKKNTETHVALCWN